MLGVFIRHFLSFNIFFDLKAAKYVVGKKSRTVSKYFCSSRSHKLTMATNLSPIEHADDKSQNFYKFGEGFVRSRENQMVSENRCFSCYMCGPLCICSAVRDMFQSSRSEQLVDSNSDGNTNIMYSKGKSSIAVFMHYKEWGRASNTGKLVHIGEPHQSIVGIYGVEDSEKKILDFITTTPTIVLYPSANAQPISEYRDWYSSTPNACLCVIDSTWTQSSAIDKIIPAHIPRVKVDEGVTAPSQYLNRKQSTNTTKVSTIEAVAIALTALGEPQSAVAPFYQALHLSVDSVLKQSGRPVAYGHRLTPQLSLNPKHNGPFTALSVEKPPSCPRCGALKETTNFKNLGTHKLKSSGGNTLAGPTGDDAYEDEGGGGGDDGGLREWEGEGQAYRVWKCAACRSHFEWAI